VYLCTGRGQGKRFKFHLSSTSAWIDSASGNFSALAFEKLPGAAFTPLALRSVGRAEPDLAGMRHVDIGLPKPGTWLPYVVIFLSLGFRV
jgi:hypothetical protein